MEKTIDYPKLYDEKALEILKVLSGLNQQGIKNVLNIVDIKLPQMLVMQID